MSCLGVPPPPCNPACLFNFEAAPVGIQAATPYATRCIQAATLCIQAATLCIQALYGVELLNEPGDSVKRPFEDDMRAELITYYHEVSRGK